MGKAERAEKAVGVAALIVGVAVLTLTAMANRMQAGGDGAAMRLVADFARVDGIHIGAPVRLAGVDVGRVTQLDLDGRFRAVATLTFDRDVPIPDDSAAVVETDGIFGAKYVEIQPGGSEANLKSGGRIDFTQDSVIIEDLISRIVQQAKTAKDAAKDGNS
jgi:phospholipid/cholesterol/gamma-HCH transport system substrate-binding protein